MISPPQQNKQQEHSIQGQQQNSSLSNNNNYNNNNIENSNLYKIQHEYQKQLIKKQMKQRKISKKLNDDDESNLSKASTISKYLVYLAIVISIGAYLFFTGFLLIRFELPLKSQCQDSPLPTPNRFSGNINSDNGGCWMPASYKKAVIVVIDALRFDFVAKQPTDNQLQQQQLSPYFHNHLKNLTSLLDNKPDNTVLYRFISDSPTVTMQRIKGITTGSLPTFIDVGSNFGGDAIVEDNLVHQLSFDENRNIRKKVVFIGDDTWVSLFPNHFYSQYPFPSFNVKDIHTVDYGVIDNLLPTITRMETDKDGTDSWHVAIGHLLGVDHVGHTYGPSHPEMIKKLAQMDDFLNTIINNINDETLFILMGDHGMTPDGNHGGSTKEEMEAALFMYSPGRPINSGLPKEFQSNEIKNISQIDLVSTISLLLGVPIPYGNLGSVIPEVFVANDHDQRQGWHRLLDAQRITSWQIKRYLDSYSKISLEFPQSLIKHFNQLIDRAESDYSSLSPDDVASFHSVYRQYKQLQEEFVELCREIWATFDTFSMKCGLAIMVVALVVIFTMLYVIGRMSTSSIGYYYPVFPLRQILSYSLVGLFSSIPLYFIFFSDCSFVVTSITSVCIFSLIGLFNAITSAPLQTVTGANITQFLTLSNLKQIQPIPTVLFILPLLTIILHGVSQSSNSFLEAQQGVVNYFGLTSLLISMILLYQNKLRWTVSDTIDCVMILVSVYFTSPSFRSQNFSSYFLFSTLESDLNSQSLTALILNSFVQWAWCIPTLYFFSSELTYRLQKYFHVSLKFSHTIATLNLIAVSGYFYVYHIAQLTQTSYFVRVIFPWTVYALTIGGIALTMTRKPATLEPTKNLFFKMSELVMIFFGVLILILGPSTLPTLTWIIIQISLITRLMGDVMQQRPSTKFKTGIYWLLTCSIFGFLSLLHFFSTGHEYQFSKIQFDAAFIGFEEHLFWRDGLLVILNTFSSPIFFALFLPIYIIYSRHLLLPKTKVSPPLSPIDFSPQSSNNSNNATTTMISVNSSDKSLQSIFIGYLIYITFFLFNTINMCISVYFLRRHLMVWRVFAPKYLFETVQLLTVLIFIVISSLLITFFKSKIKN